MSEKLEALWIVTRIHRDTFERGRVKVFRSRSDARLYAARMGKASKAYIYAIARASWGPA